MPSNRQDQRHQSSDVAVLDKAESGGSPFRQFFAGLEEFSMAVSLYGPSSLEAGEARAHVRRLREQAAAAWREKAAKAA
jgi:hypothetical protein